MAKTVALVTDLIFATRIRSTAEAVGAEVAIIRDVEALSTAGEVGQVIIDLNVTSADPIAAIAAAHSLPGRPRVICYLSHVQANLARAAREAGADEVLARSAFVEALPRMLKCHSDANLSPPRTRPRHESNPR